MNFKYHKSLLLLFNILVYLFALSILLYWPCFIGLALLTLLYQPCFINLALPTLLYQPCLLYRPCLFYRPCLLYLSWFCFDFIFRDLVFRDLTSFWPCISVQVSLLVLVICCFSKKSLANLKLIYNKFRNVIYTYLQFTKKFSTGCR